MDNYTLESFINFCDDMMITNEEYLKLYEDMDVVNEGATEVLSGIISAGLMIASGVAIVMTKVHNAQVRAAISLYRTNNPNVLSIKSLKHKTYKIKMFTEGERGKEIKGTIRKWFADRSNKVIQVYYDDNGKELFGFLFSDKSIVNKMTGKVDYEFYLYDKSLKEDANYYMAVGCINKGLVGETCTAWAKKYLKDNNYEMSKLDYIAAAGQK